VSFLSSDGVAVIIRLLRQQAANGGDLVVRSPSVTVQRVLDVTGLSRLLDLEP
jgi:anti-anti-sigma factor